MRRDDNMEPKVKQSSMEAIAKRWYDIAKKT